MNDRTTTMSDDELDRTIARYLGWRAEQVLDAPSANVMASRLIGTPRVGQRRRLRRLVVLALAGLIALAAFGALSVATRPPDATDLFADSRLILADARGWNVVAPKTDATGMEPCDGLCPTGSIPVASRDGQAVFYVETTPVLEDTSVAEPGWSLWRWDRREDSVARVAGCGPTLCAMGPPVPSPDGRLVAYLELSSPDPRLASGVVTVVDAATGRPVSRRPVDWIASPAWDADGRLLITDCAGSCRPDDRQYLRVDLTTDRVEEVGADLPRGHLASSPDGRTILIDATDYATWDPGTVEILVADQALMTARPAFVIDDVSYWGRLSWAPRGTAFANVVMTSPELWSGDVRTYDLSSGEVVSWDDRGLHETSLLWLADD